MEICTTASAYTCTFLAFGILDRKKKRIKIMTCQKFLVSLNGFLASEKGEREERKKGKNLKQLDRLKVPK